jgi:hypothetical protein
MTRAIYDDGDCEDFELFDAVVKLLKAIEHKTFSEVQRAQEILRIIESIIKDLNQIAGSTVWSISTVPTAGM